MKKFLVISAFLALWCLPTKVCAQRVEVGSYAPYIHNVEWISDRPERSRKAQMVEFFHSSNDECREHIEHLNALACYYRKEMDVVMLTREPSEQVAGMLLHEYQYFYVATDESGDMFRAYGVSHVPYAVLINRKGVVVWCGNPMILNDSAIRKLLQQ